MSPNEKLKAAGISVKALAAKGSKPAEPVWKGPSSPDPQGGITFSLLCKFLNCRERFRLLVIEGLAPADGFNHRLEYGNMWHICEEGLAADSEPGPEGSRVRHWEDALEVYVAVLGQRYPLQRKLIRHWHRVCLCQFPYYVDYWARHPDVVDRKPVMQEESFRVEYPLPSGRKVFLRGKFDATDVIGKLGRPGTGLYLQENKSKGDPNEQLIKRQLTFDLQTMLYLVALHCFKDQNKGRLPPLPILGVRYNVVKRPLSGGAGTIRQHKPSKSNPKGESEDEFYTRLAGIIEESPGSYFMRWKVEVTQDDIRIFRQQCLDPILEQLCDWYEWVTKDPKWPGQENPFQSFVPMPNKLHWRHPFGVYNALNEGGSSELDEYLSTGSEVGLTRIRTLFGELEQESEK